MNTSGWVWQVTKIFKTESKGIEAISVIYFIDFQ